MSRRRNKSNPGNGLPAGHPQEANPEHRAFLIRSLERNDGDLAALVEVNRSLHVVKSNVVDSCGEIVLLDLGCGELELLNGELISNKQHDLTPLQKQICVQFLQFMTLRRKLSNRLARRLNRVAHAMDGEDVKPPPAPKYGDMRPEVDPAALQASVERWETVKRARSQIEQVAKEQKRQRLLQLPQALKLQSATITIESTVESEDAPLSNQSSLDQDVPRPAPGPTSSSLHSKNEPISFIPTVTDDLQATFDVLKEYDEIYQKKLDPSTNNISYAITPATPEEELLAIKGIGAANSNMNAKEKEMEHKRWQTALLSRIPDQPTFEELGLSKRVFQLEARRKKCLQGDKGQDDEAKENDEEGSTTSGGENDSNEDKDEEMEQAESDDGIKEEATNSEEDKNKMKEDIDDETAQPIAKMVAKEESQGEVALTEKAEEQPALENAKKKEDDKQEEMEVASTEKAEEQPALEIVKKEEGGKQEETKVAPTEKAQSTLENAKKEEDDKQEEMEVAPTGKVEEQAALEIIKKEEGGKQEETKVAPTEKGEEQPTLDKTMGEAKHDVNQEENPPIVVDISEKVQDGAAMVSEPVAEPRINENDENDDKPVAVADSKADATMQEEKAGESKPATTSSEAGEEKEVAKAEEKTPKVEGPTAYSENEDVKMEEIETANSKSSTGELVKEEKVASGEHPSATSEEVETKVPFKNQAATSHTQKDAPEASSDKEKNTDVSGDAMDVDGALDDKPKEEQVANAEELVTPGLESKTEEEKEEKQSETSKLKEGATESSGADGSSDERESAKSDDNESDASDGLLSSDETGDESEEGSNDDEDEEKKNEQAVEPPKRIKPMNLSAVPSFHEQDLKRIRLVHGDIMAASMHEHAHRRLSEVTKDYNVALRMSMQLQERIVALEHQINLNRHESRAQLNKLNTEFNFQVSVAKKQWLQEKQEFDTRQVKNVFPSTFGHNPMGTQATSNFVRHGGIAGVIGSCLADVVDGTTIIVEGKAPRPQKFRDFVPPPTPPVLNASSGESLAQKATRMDEQMRHQHQEGVTRLKQSEEERKKAWKKVMKTKAEYEMHDMEGGRRGNRIDMSNYHMVPMPVLNSGQTQMLPHNFNIARPAMASHGPLAAVGTPSKYSTARVKARIARDGSVIPVTEPKKTKDGLYQRPAGRTRKGMQWDAVRGMWVPEDN